MISRPSTFATVFALSVAAAVAVTAQAHTPLAAPAVAAMPAAKFVRIVELPRVVVVARRLDRTAP